MKKKFKFDIGDIIIFKSSLLHSVEPILTGKRHVMINFMWDEEGELFRKHKYPALQHIDYSVKHIEKQHDIDYSNIYNCKHTDSDCFLYEDNNSEILLVSFAGFGVKESVPTFIFKNFLKSYNNIDKLFLRDVKCHYYLTGLKNNTTDIHDTIRFIKNIIKNKKYKKIFAIGCSSGGFAAILYGNLLKFDKIIAFAPQVVLNDNKKKIINDNIHGVNSCKMLSNYSKDNFFLKCLNLKLFIPFTSNVEIHFPKLALGGVDKRHAEYIQHDKCKIIGYDSSNHRIALELRDKGILKKIIDGEIN